MHFLSKLDFLLVYGFMQIYIKNMFRTITTGNRNEGNPPGGNLNSMPGKLQDLLVDSPLEISDLTLADVLGPATL